ncbi:coiled-coil-helix-coiled-coil-helix domain-containing protein 5 [Electrophorus electricus]|uniref:IMS import disulfide relay-system CHCH-CHCH-like Cx9C domain-containing protein n=1 Tax=Electrophorus electricus TaxID=8005 RepID=A0A4W4H3L2_ELEEL|nr:coiled-coil-helix-coiled-coil-helix domain-containing protein 5 [Electrophorus electricus]
MEAAMKITAKYCRAEVEEYGGCVASNPSAWQKQCEHLKLKVAQCTSSHPVIRKIRTDCAGEFREFERCLQENQASAQTCSTHVVRFLTCAESVDINGLGNAVPQPT